jgi:hypothetical protein
MAHIKGRTSLGRICAAPVTLILLALPAVGTAQAPAPAAARAAVDSLISTMGFAYGVCPLQIQLIVTETYARILRKEAVDVQAVIASQQVCPDSTKAVAESQFQRAREAAVSPEARSLLRDAYAFFRANLNELQPRTLEEAALNMGAAYTARTRPLSQTLREKLERVRIEL